MKKVQQYTQYSNGVLPTSSKGKWMLTSDYEKLESLFKRFVEFYGGTPLFCEIETGLKLWRDYYEHSGEHMILTEEGWEPGSGKPEYERIASTEGVELSELILDEVNVPEVTPLPGKVE